MTDNFIKNNFITLNKLSNLDQNSKDNKVENNVKISTKELNVDLKIFFDSILLKIDKKNYHEAKALNLDFNKKISNYSPSWNSLGVIYSALNDNLSAKTSFEKSLEIDSNNFHALTNLGKLYYSQNNYLDAIKCFQKILDFENIDKVEFNYNKINENLIRCYILSGSCDEAINKANQLIDSGYKTVRNYNLLAEAYLKKYDYKNSLEAYFLALELDPENSVIYTNIGNLYQITGQLKESADFYLKSFDYDKHSTYSFRSLATMSPELITDEILNNMLKLHDLIFTSNKHSSFILKKAIVQINGNDEDITLIDLGYGLFKYFDYIGEHDKAFSYLENVNKNLYKFYTNSNEFMNEFINPLDILTDINTKVFNDSFSFKSSDSIDIDKKLVFIVGMPRSGTTLLEQILSSHSKINGLGERNEIPNLFSSFFKLYGYNIGSSFLKDKDVKKTFDAISLREKLLKASKKDITDSRNYYLKDIQNYIQNHNYVIDKMPSNFYRIGLIRGLFPNAKIIHIKRNDMDTCFSNFSTFFTDEQVYSYDQKHLGYYFNNYLRIMNYWENSKINNFITVRYENIVNDMEFEIRKVIKFLGLSFEEQCLDFHNNKRDVRTASVTQVRKKLYKSSINKAKIYEGYLDILKKILVENN